MSAYFIKHPVIATVIAVVTTLLGLVCLQNLPIAQYPEITPTIVQLQGHLPRRGRPVRGRFRGHPAGA